MQEEQKQPQRTRIQVPTEIITLIPLTEPKLLKTYIEYLIYQDLLKNPSERIITNLMENQQALHESRHALMIDRQDTLLTRYKNNPLIKSKQIRLLETLRPLITCNDTKMYLDGIIKKHIGEDTTWIETTPIQRQVTKFREWTQGKSLTRNT